MQIFRPDGTFVSEHIYNPATLAQGSTWDIAFSPDEDQEFIYLADGQNFKISIIDRASMEVLYTFGDGGRQPGLFYAPHSIATDSRVTSIPRRPMRASAYRSSCIRVCARSPSETAHRPASIRAVSHSQTG